MALARLKTNDEVVVISGKDRGKRGRVLRVLRKSDKVLVEGVNIVTRHLRRNPQNPQSGGRQEKPAPIPACKVMLWSDEAKRGVRVRAEGSGKAKQRIAAQGKKPIGSPARGSKKPAK